jgi:hypothetical protein
MGICSIYNRESEVRIGISVTVGIRATVSVTGRIARNSHTSVWEYAGWIISIAI